MNAHAREGIPSRGTREDVQGARRAAVSSGTPIRGGCFDTPGGLCYTACGSGWGVQQCP